MKAGVYDELVAAAESASKEFGKESPEAKSAWEAVEEYNDGENVAVASKPPLDEACDASDSAECANYEDQMKQFSEIISGAKPALGEIKVQLETMKSIDLSTLVSSSATETNTVDVEAATAAAEAASKEFGADSPEAKSAWEAVEDLNDAMNPTTASVPALDQACITDAVEKCIAFEDAMATLEKAVNDQAVTVA